MLPIAIIGGVVAIIWVVAFFRFGGLLGGNVACLVLGVCFGWFFFHQDVGPLPITVDRLALGGLGGLYLLLRIWGLTEAKPWAPEDTLLVVFLAVLLGSVVFNPSGDFDTAAASLWLFFFVTPGVVYWIAKQSPISRSGSQGALLALIGLGLYLALTGVAEKQGWTGVVFPRYIVDPTHEEFFGRARGPLLNPIGNGLFLTVAFVAARLWWPDLSARGRMVLGASMLVIGVGVICTMTRSVWLGAAAATVLPTAVYLTRAQRAGLAALLAVAVLGLFALKGSNLAEFKRDKNVSAHDMAQSAKLRPLLATIAWRMVQERPFFGCGLRRYVEVSHDYINERFTDMPIEKARGYVQHNVFLALLVETGIVGLGLYLALLGYWSYRAWRLAHTPHAPTWAKRFALLFLAFLAAFGINGMFHDVGVIMMVNQLLMLLAGVTAGLSSRFAPVALGVVERSHAGPHQTAPACR